MKRICAGSHPLSPICLRCHHRHVTMACIGQAARLALAHLGDASL